MGIAGLDGHPRVSPSAVQRAPDDSPARAADPGATSPPRGLEDHDRFEARAAAPRADVLPASESLIRKGLCHAKEKVVERAWNEVCAEHGIDILKRQLADDVTLGIRIKEKLYRAEDASIADDPLRKDTSAGIEVATGRAPLWLETGGLTKISGDLSLEVPLSGPLFARTGFSGETLVEYRSLRPLPVTADGAIAAIGQHTIGLPFDAAQARSMEPGSEVELVGKGTAAVSGALGARAGLSRGLLGASASAEIKTEAGRSAVFSIRIRRLAEDRVEVLLSEIHDRFRTFGASLQGGPEVDGMKMIDATLGDLIDPSRGKVSLDPVTAWLAEGERGEDLVHYLERQGAKHLEDAVKDYATFHASVGRDVKETRTDQAKYVFHLDQPSAAAAYEAMIRLNPAFAATGSNVEGSGIERHTIRRFDSERCDHGEIRFGGKKLILTEALRKETMLIDRRDVDQGKRPEITRVSHFDKKLTSLFGGEQSICWSGVSAPSDAVGDARTTFLHLGYEKHDKITRDEEIETFVRFADFLGIADAKPRKIELPRSSLFHRIFCKDDDTRVAVEIYFTDDGAERIAKASARDVRRAYAAAVGAVEPKLAGVPLDDAVCQSLALAYGQNRNEAFSPPYDRALQLASKAERARILAAYARETGGRRLGDDFLAFRRAAILAAHVRAMGSTGEEEGWSRFLSDLGETRGFGYMQEIGALACLAGPEHTLVHQLSMSGKLVTLEAIDEGRLEDPALEA